MITRTLDNLFDNTQDLFNHICEHLMNQGQRSTAPFGCAYRGVEEGVACAVGACIPEEYYDSAREGYRVAYLTKHAVVPSWVRDNVYLLEDLQIIHDTRAPESWKYELQNIARQWKLELPKCIR